ncbi:hypothetical protein BU17DRAFT_85461 [Hysterangium stoloniferum]|nr:hypothetical protein BU17DRAFT_85461 [Hysterangium stoloniferum]
MNFSRRNIPPGWYLHIHPQGSPYFSNDTWRVVTSNDITNVQIREAFEDLFTKFLEKFGRHLELLADYEVSMQIDEDTLDNYQYHVMDHQTRRVITFPRGEWNEHDEVPYWSCFSEYPMHHHLPPAAELDMVTSLVYFSSEYILGNRKTTTPFSLEVGLKFISLLKTFRQREGQTARSAAYD